MNNDDNLGCCDVNVFESVVKEQAQYMILGPG